MTNPIIMTTMRRALTCLALTAPALAAHADDDGGLFHPANANIVKLGIVHLDLHSDTTGLTGIGVPAGADLRIGNATTLYAGIERLITPQIGIEFAGGIPPRQDAYGAGSIAFYGRVASVKQSAPTLLLNYHFFDETARVRPYLGIGYNHTHFYGAESYIGETLSLTNSNGAAVQGGVNVRIDDHWAAFASVLVVKVRSHLLATDVNPQSTTINFRPTAYVAGLSYGF